MIRIAGLEKESIVDGEGIRYVIFTQGCNHNCLGCHNPESHDFNGGTLIDDTVILNDIKNNCLLDGITLSGGDPMFQAKDLINIVKQCKENKMSIWLYTGFTFEQFLKFKRHDKENVDTRITKDMIELLKYIDIVVDGPFVMELKTMEKPYVGSSNQRIIDVQKSLRTGKIVLYKK